MSDDLVKRWDDHVESLCSPMSTIEHMAQKMRNRIEALTAEREALEQDNHRWKMECENFWRDREKTLTADFARQVQRTDEQREAYEQALSVMEAERDRLRALLAEADCRIAWEAHGFGNDFADQVQAALKGETP